MTEVGTPVGQYQIIWPWTWYHVLKHIVEDDVDKPRVIILALFFWATFPKYDRHPIDDPLVQDHLTGTSENNE